MCYGTGSIKTSTGQRLEIQVQYYLIIRDVHLSISDMS
jgi:hypothetical protein